MILPKTMTGVNSAKEAEPIHKLAQGWMCQSTWVLVTLSI